MTMYVALRDSPPHHIEKWRTGSEGERRTARKIRALEREGWLVRHDLDGGSGANLDHVLVSGAGVFLLDSKNYSGEGMVEGSELRVRWLEDPEDGLICEGIVQRMRAASAELKERIEEATGVRLWVQPVVVLWMRFPQRVAQSSDVVFIHGDAVVAWLRQRQPTARPFDQGGVMNFVKQIPAARDRLSIQPRSRTHRTSGSWHSR
jgi:hypothetical protein